MGRLVGSVVVSVLTEGGMRNHRIASACALLLVVPVLSFAQSEVPRMASGRPDLSGTYDIATLTPLQRPQEFGERDTLNAEETALVETDPNALRELYKIGPGGSDERRAARVRESGETDEAGVVPPVGGDGSSGAAGNVGGYNTFWIDRGSGVFRIDGKFRTSIITDPANGRRPPLSDAARAAAQRRATFFRANNGKAWWLEDGLEAPGPYDDPEIRPLAERCLLGFGSTAGPPMLPVLYNNLKKIVQTEDHIMILVEMVHDARIVRMNEAHAPDEIRSWLGDSVGHWDGDTLVVDTTNFNDSPALGGASRNLHVVERFTRIGPEGLLYEFTVNDPAIWTEPWSGEYVWPATETRVYEYACHEANYSFRGILGGARILETDVRTGAVEPRD